MLTNYRLISLFLLRSAVGVFCVESLPALAGGITIDGAGIMVVCGSDEELKKSSSAHYFEGEFMLDYILSFNPDRPFLIGRNGESFDEISSEIIARLKQRSPVLGSAYEAFVSSIGRSNPNAEYSWQGTSLPLLRTEEINIPSENELDLPRNCKIEKAGLAVPNTYMAVMRKQLVTDPQKKIFRYYQPKFDSLRTSFPLQFSFLSLHEFLWDVTDYPWVNRVFNDLIHSEEFTELSSQEFVRHLKSFGIEITEAGRIVRLGDTHRQLENIFRKPEACNWDLRLVKEFEVESESLIVEPGQSLTLKLQLKDAEERLGQEICGLAVVLPYRLLGSASPLNVILARGVAKDKLLLNAQSQIDSKLVEFGLCSHGCFERHGTLKKVLAANTTFLGEWTLTIENATGGAPLIVNRPYMTFVRSNRGVLRE